jgi:hypothetical protein
MLDWDGEDLWKMRGDDQELEGAGENGGWGPGARGCRTGVQKRKTPPPPNRMGAPVARHTK